MQVKTQTAEAFAPMWETSARYKGAWGGRGSGKSWDRAQAIVVAMISRPGVRIACVREVQNSIKDSVYQLIVDSIQRMGVGHLFNVVEAEIRGPNGSLCIFKGMKDQNAESVKSLEGIDIVWWEEAQTAQQRSLDILRPTIRKEGSELWFTWNPRLRSDPIDVFLRQTDHGADAVVVEAQWRDNPWFSDTLEAERQIDLKGDPDRYAHIWEGAYEAESDMQFIGGGMVRRAAAREAYSEMSDAQIMGVDVARFGDDRSVIYMRRGRDARSIAPIVFSDKIDTMQLVGHVADMLGRHHVDAIFVDEGGVGGGVVDRLRQMNINVVGVNFGRASDRWIQGAPKAANKRSEMWASMREWLRDGGAIPDDRDLEMDLTGPLYKFDVNNAIFLEKKEDMKKRGVRSSDIADALALTFAYPVTGRALQRAEDDRLDEAYDPVWG